MNPAAVDPRRSATSGQRLTDLAEVSLGLSGHEADAKSSVHIAACDAGVIISAGGIDGGAPASTMPDLAGTGRGDDGMHASLRLANDHLEHLVAKRTAQLATANVRLGDDLRQRETADAELRARNTELTELNKKLTATQQLLVQSEKMASIGRLAAGVAHEINNPIGLCSPTWVRCKATWIGCWPC